ncbi:HEPN domain-containing protein [Acidithiobacillus sp.]|jgi:uncharacterized protein (UPF0332 family)|uniref:HEPN domain-containing protein n=1 Tax=Acidithiobacillus sp. TaxID=1872118 RepID=UPI0035693947
MNKAANDLMIKARRAHKSALVLLKESDFEGAVNRAYYAMHDAAKAALVHERAPGADSIKTHSGLISAFSQHIVKVGKIDTEFNKVLPRAEQARLIADYGGGTLTKMQATEQVGMAKSFLDEVDKRIVRSQQLGL